MTTADIALGSSAEYLPHAAASMHSLLEHRGGLDVRVHYLHGPDFPRERAGDLAAMVRRGGGTLELHEVSDTDIAGLPAAGHIPPAMWYRSFLAHLLPDVERVLYLDADTLAVDALAPLLDMDLEGNYAAAVANVWEPWNLDYPRSLGLEDPNEYFNSGVMLMDLGRIRGDRLTEQVLELARSGRRLVWGDQDALNVVMAGRWLHLHPRWNCMNSVMVFERAAEVFGAEAVAEARAHPAIRHFEGPAGNKPWHVLCERPLRDLYERHRRATPWPEVEREGRTPRALAKLAWRRLRI